jgi:hypothetical protein
MQRLQNEIKTVLNAYNDFDALQSMGDRASAAEAGNAVGAIAQGLATHQNAIMQLYADIARQCIANRVAYSPDDTFSVVSNGEYKTLTVQQMALTATINVKSRLAKRIEQKMLASSALTMLGSLKDILNEKGIAYLASQALYENAPRKMIENFINMPQASEQQQQTAALEAQNMANQLAQNEQAYQQNPIPYEAGAVMENPENTPEDIDAIIAGIGMGGAGGDTAIEPPTDDLAEASGNAPQPIDMVEQEGAMATGLPNQTPDIAGLMANPNSLAI